ncbi:hypothetical protein Micbo1qcDRAFT_124682, partial [Microdochium bolleyi]
FQWYESMHAEVKSKPKGTEEPSVMGFASAGLVRRRDMRGNFHQAIEEPSSETAAMGIELFDRYGNLRNKHKMSGSKIWGDELDQGDILLLNLVQVDKASRRRGLGTQLCTSLIKAALYKSNPQSLVVLAYNGAVTGEIDSNVQCKELSVAAEAQMRMSAQFLRSVGLRRIGTTDWFALSGNPRHACHQLAAAEDFDRPLFTQPQKSELLDQLLGNLRSASVSDAGSLQALETRLNPSDQRDQAWTATDPVGNNILHLAACRGKFRSTKWIVDHYPALLEAHNAHGETPLGVCQSYMEEIRTQLQHGAMTIMVADHFSGFQQNFIDTVKALKGNNELTDHDFKRIKFGCTCGQCDAGFLSPRMRQQLFWAVEPLYDELTMMYECTEDDAAMFVDELTLMYGCFPVELGIKMRTNKAVRKGFVEMFNHFAECLRSDRLPTEANVRQVAESKLGSEWPRVTQTYLERGGTIACVGACVFESAMDSSLLAGDGSALDGAGTLDAYDALPKCRNDEDFGFVSRQCGYGCVSRGL